MKRGYSLATTALLFTIYNFAAVSRASDFQYPYYLIHAHHASSECWIGIDGAGNFPAVTDPNKYLVGPPPSIADSAVTLPTDSWIELLFRGVIIDGPGDDLYVSEMDPMGEQALVFLTDGADQEYLLGVAEVPDTAGHLATIVGFDIAGLVLPFEPRAVRVVGIDLKGGSPGFDLSYVSARIGRNRSETANYPYPPDKAEHVPVDAVLDWVPGSYSNKYNVYFGKDISNVYPGAAPGRTSASPSGEQDANTFDPDMLELGKTYYWRIDQVNETDPNRVIPGIPWSFSVQKYEVVDDFDEYLTGTEFDAVWQLADESSFSHLGLAKSDDGAPVHSCAQGMKINYYYDDTQACVVSHRFATPQDWIARGVKSIELFFQGVKYNLTDCKMYVVLGDGSAEVKIPYSGDANDIAQETWQPWRMPLNSVSQSVDLRHIENISIRLEKDPNSSNFSSYGTIFLDDIRLYPSRCLPGDRPDADFNGDCVVDFRDYDELAYNWLESGYNIYEVQEPNRSPIFWYKFENDVVDSTGHAHGNVEDSRQYDQGVFGQALRFDGTQAVNVYPVSHIFSRVQDGITIAFWEKGNDSPHRRDTMFCTDYAYNTYDPAISVNLGCWDGTGIYNFDCGPSLTLDKRVTGRHRYKAEWTNWNHWAFTKDLKTGLMQVFLNGRPVKSRTSSVTSLPTIGSFTIGSGWYGGFDGLMDDMRIYDYPLSQAEIAYIATGGTGIFDLALFSQADLNNSNTIDYDDLRLLVDHWLESRLFPAE